MLENENDLLGLLMRVGELLHRYHHCNHRRHGPMGDPHRGQGRVLALLKMRPEISQKDLSYLLDIRPQSLGELLAKLERNGYIERSVSENDRRGMNIRLTPEGEKTAETPPESEDLFSCLDMEEQAGLAEYLRRIQGELETQISRYMEEECERPHDGPHGRHGRGCHGGGPHGHGPKHFMPHLHALAEHGGRGGECGCRSALESE